MSRSEGGVPRLRDGWAVTTHDWSHEIDTAHLEEAARVARDLGPAMPLHLLLEVMAYADDEAEATGRQGRVTVTIRGNEVEIADDGRGTDTRRDELGRPVRKPVMATRDVRFFDADEPPLLPDGRPRRGMSTVAAVSPFLIHENRREEGAWRQTYRHGRPDSDLHEVPGDGRAGTTVSVRLPAEIDEQTLRPLVAGFAHLTVRVTREEVLAGGNASGEVVRVGETIRKPWSPTSSRTIAYLTALRERGLDVPEAHGRDERDRLVLDFVPGALAMDSTPLEADLCRRVGALVRRIHDASAGLHVPDDWDVLIPAEDPDLLCHNDLAPWNLVIDGDRLVFIDWDGAGPSTRLWDLAYAAVAFGHLVPGADVAEAAARLSAFVHGYDADEDLRRDLPATMAARAGAMHDLLQRSHETGREPWGSMYVDGHGDHWAGVTEFIEEHQHTWAAAFVTSGGSGAR